MRELVHRIGDDSMQIEFALRHNEARAEAGLSEVQEIRNQPSRALHETSPAV